MKLFFIILLISMNSLAAIRVDLHFPKKDLKQGALAKGVFSFSSEATQVLPPQKLKSLTFAKTLYIQNASTLTRSEGQSTFQSEAKLIFIKVPESPVLTDSVNGVDVEIHLGDITVAPTEAAEKLIFGEFTIPDRPKLIRWGLITLSLLVGTFFGLKFYNHFKKKKKAKLHKLKLKEQISSAKDYQEVVAVWKSKHRFIEAFPNLEIPYRNLEIVLFKYQFKASQTEQEKSEVLSAYKKFLDESAGGFNGI